MTKHKHTRAIIMAISVILMSAAAAFSSGILGGGKSGDLGDDEKVTLVPEAGRKMEFAVLGLWPNSESVLFFPDTKWPAAATGAQKKFIEERFYWLNFELTHGDIIPNLPPYTHFYIGLPDKRFVPGSRGREKEYFIDYLKINVGLSDKDIRERFSFFKSPVCLEWPQDICKVLGYDAGGRAVLGYCNSDMPEYPQTVKALGKAFPGKFVLKNMGDTVSMEGGDENMVTGPDNNILYVAGRHRALRFLGVAKNIDLSKSSVSGD